jgi:hypothetical protein
MSTSGYSLEYHNGTTWVAIAAGSVLDVSGSWETSGDGSGIAFGSDTDATISGSLLLASWSVLAYMTPIRYTTTMDADTTRTFTGVVSKRGRDLDQMTFEAAGMKLLIAATKRYSVAIARRPVATKTTATSADDVTNPGWASGLINWLLWTAGGRPNEQAGSYPSATFYYSCDHALLAPDWSWAAGEDAWAECLRLAKDAGGQMYQDASGVVRYKQVLGYGGQSTSDSLDESDYATIEMTEDPGLIFATKITCQYVPRRRLGTQEVVDDTTPRPIEPSASATIVLEPQNPLASLEQLSAGQLKSEALNITLFDGTPSTSYTHTLDITAARITIVVTNTATVPIMVWRVRLRGDPIVSGEAGSAVADSGATPVVERVLEQSPYIQNRRDAQRIVDMTLAHYGSARPIVSVGGCVHRPSRAIGAALLLACGAWGMSAVKHVVLSISHNDTGVSQDLQLAYCEDLPAVDAFFVVGVTYTSGQNKFLGW